MKTCPTCGASCFEDMEVCYGCLHRFDGGGDEEKRPAEKMSDALLASKSLRMSFGESGAQKPEAEPANAGNLGAAELSDARRFVQTDQPQAAPQAVYPLTEDEPLALHARETRGDTNISEEKSRKGQGQDEWVMRVSIPAGCEGVTVRLEKA